MAAYPVDGNRPQTGVNVLAVRASGVRSSRELPLTGDALGAMPQRDAVWKFGVSVVRSHRLYTQEPSAVRVELESRTLEKEQAWS